MLMTLQGMTGSRTSEIRYIGPRFTSKIKETQSRIFDEMEPAEKKSFNDGDIEYSLSNSYIASYPGIWDIKKLFFGAPETNIKLKESPTC